MYPAIEIQTTPNPINTNAKTGILLRGNFSFRLSGIEVGAGTMVDSPRTSNKGSVFWVGVGVGIRVGVFVGTGVGVFVAIGNGVAVGVEVGLEVGEDVGKMTSIDIGSLSELDPQVDVYRLSFIAYVPFTGLLLSPIFVLIFKLFVCVSVTE